MDREDRMDVYTIPPNFAEEGTMFSGRIKTRNAVETALILLVAVPLLLSLPITAKGRLYVGMIVLVPAVIISIIGIQGEILFAFVASFFRYLGRRRFLGLPDERYRLEQSRRREKAERGGRRSREKRKSKEKPEKGVEAGTQTGQTGTEEGEKKEKAGQGVPKDHRGEKRRRKGKRAGGAL